MCIASKTHFYHRAWRHRLWGDKFGIGFLLSRNLSGATVVDAGAHKGAYTYWLQKKVGQTGRVFAFEPQPKLAAELNELKEELHFKPIEVVNCGLSDKEAQAELMCPYSRSGCASFDIPPTASFQTVGVQVRTLDAFREERGITKIRFIKCDVEGHEQKVLAGARKTLLQDRPAILIESLEPESADSVLYHIDEYGYRAFCFTRTGLAPIEKYPELKVTLHKKALQNFALLPEEEALWMGTRGLTYARSKG